MINVLEMLEHSAATSPEATAFADPVKKITYKELLQKAKQAGTMFIKDNVSDADCIAFFIEKSVDAVILMFGAVYANAYYSFIDVRQPKERADSMMEMLSPAFVITADNIGDILDKAAQTPIDESLLEMKRNGFYDGLPLYVNFTSGSTGIPKGVVVSHRSVIDFITVFTDIFGITASDVFANQAPFDFDVSVKDIYSGLYTGAAVWLIPREYFSNPTVLMDYLCESNVTVLVWAVSAMCFVSVMNALEYKTPESLRMIMFSGEVMPVKQLAKWKKYLPDATYVNLYGPTEITCNCTYHVLDREYDKDDVIPVGKAFPNEKVFLLDEADALICEKDTEGEICVAGACLALGYLNDPERTNASFVLNPLNKMYPEKMYRTGDLGKYDEAGDLIYCGRKDHQIKHLGQRIELGDIESAANAADGVERACCLYDEKRKKIVLFYVGDTAKEQLSDMLHQKLPPFMIPGKTVKLDSFPMNKNGKIDRGELTKQI